MPTCPTTDAPDDGFRRSPAWLVAAAAVVVAQAGLALALFGPGHSWGAVADERPVLSGKHPLHLYHGTLGAAAFRHTRNAACYDPAFQAGYPKTPVFDGGSRPAELFALLGGSGYSPATYKRGLFVFLLLIPVAFIAAARGAGVPPGAAVLAGCGGVMLGWSPAVRHMLVEGQLDLLAAGLAAAVFVPWLGTYARNPGVESWLVLAALAAVGWYAHPLVWLGLGPILFVFYLVFAPRHGPGWHLGLAGVVTVGIAPNAWWLVDWGKFWWLRQPSADDHIPLPAWRAILGEPADVAALCSGLPGGPAIPLIALGGIIFLWVTRRCASAGLAVVALGVAVALARVAAAWPRMPADVPGRVAPLAAAFLVPAAAFGTWELLRRASFASVGTVLAAGLLVVVAWADGPGDPLARGLGVHSDPLAIGFTPEQQQLLEAIERHTTPDARVLWEDDPRAAWPGSPLLPLYTGRAYLGGLDTDSEIEHGYCALSNQQLNGRPLSEWTDAEVTEFCRWYNVGWVVCRSAGAAERWQRCPSAKVAARLTDGGRPVVLIALDRPRSFVLAGSATWESADSKRIVLTDVRPNAEGVVDLSLHAFEGLKVFPSLVRMDAVKDASDPVGHIRLYVPGPIPRVTIVWERP